MSTSSGSPDFHGPFALSKRLACVPIGFLAAIIALFSIWPQLAHHLLSSAYMPHLYCYLGSTSLAWTHAIADSLIGVTYLVISGTLAYLLYRGKSDVPFHVLFLAFALFIIACGSSHIVETITVWVPVYVLSAVIKVITAIASLVTALVLPFFVPDILLLVQTARNSEARRVLLEAVLTERDAAQKALKQSNAALEERVRERTVQITRAKDGLEAEVMERRRNEELLRQSEERFSKAFRSNPLAITISTEAEGRYLDVNEAFLRLLGYTRRDVIGETAEELRFWVQPSQRIEMLRQLREIGMVKGLRTQYATFKGEIRQVDVSAELIELQGQPCVLVITRDITETQRLEEQFQQAQKMEAVGRLVGGVAHDFNNILGVIIGYSDLPPGLVDPNSPVNRHFEQIKRASNLAVSLVRQLLAFSRQQVVFPKVLALNAVVHNALDMLKRMVPEDIDISFQPLIPIGSVYADPGQVEQILMNLAVNARDAMPGGGKITIETGNAELDAHYVSQHPGSRAGQYVVLIVGDTGCGMDERVQSRIFEPFFTTKKVGQGTGLGLSTVYGIVKQSGGTIFVYSELGKGTTFKIYFPRVEQREAKPEHVLQSQEEIEFPAGFETILLVEDNEPMRELAVSILEGAGYRVIEAGNAESALDILRSSEPRIDLLITDVVMPGKSGVELLEQARVVDQNLHALFMSGYTGGQVASRGHVLHETAFLQKPFTRSSFLKKVRSALHC
jgi:two-component system cell cycle sensor histidine kinase/response regulator CckA